MNKKNPICVFKNVKQAPNNGIRTLLYEPIKFYSITASSSCTSLLSPFVTNDLIPSS